jgi:hypothetical protein
MTNGPDVPPLIRSRVPFDASVETWQLVRSTTPLCQMREESSEACPSIELLSVDWAIEISHHHPMLVDLPM